MWRSGDALCAPGLSGAGKWAASTMLQRGGDRRAARCAHASFSSGSENISDSRGGAWSGQAAEALIPVAGPRFLTSFFVQPST